MRELIIYGCGRLKQAFNDLQCATALQQLSIENCYVESILGSVKSLPALQLLSISYCCLLQSFANHVSSLDSLQRLYTSNCWALQAALPSASSLSSLQGVTVVKCNALSTVLASARSLRSLQRAVLDDTSAVEFLPNVAILSGLESLQLTNNLQLRVVFPDVSQLLGLTQLSLDSHDLFDCRHTGAHCPVSLRELSIYHSTQLQSPPQGICELKELRSLMLCGATFRGIFMGCRLCSVSGVSSGEADEGCLNALLAEATLLPSLTQLVIKASLCATSTEPPRA